MIQRTTVSLFFLVALGLVPACSSSQAASSADVVEGGDGDKAALTIHDVSVLFPLHNKEDIEQLLLATDVGDKGPLLPDWTTGQLPEDDRDQFDLGALRAVSVRFDPCAPLLTAEEASCHPQIRIVWQPVASSEVQVISGQDRNIHGIYELSADELREVVDELSALRAKETAPDGELPLAPNPVIERQGLDGDYATRIKGLIKRYAGASNLVRLAMFDATVRDELWTFAVVDVHGGEPSRVDIPTLASDVQMLEAPQGPVTTIDPPPTSQDDITPLLDALTTGAASLDDKGRQALEAALRVEDPRMHTPESIDCASCHAAPMLRTTAEERFKIDTSGSSNRFTSSAANLDGEHQMDLDSTAFQAFSYSFARPAINQRVINESALVVDYINRKMLGVE